MSRSSVQILRKSIGIQRRSDKSIRETPWDLKGGPFQSWENPLEKRGVFEVSRKSIGNIRVCIESLRNSVQILRKSIGILRGIRWNPQEIHWNPKGLEIPWNHPNPEEVPWNPKDGYWILRKSIGILRVCIEIPGIRRGSIKSWGNPLESWESLSKHWRHSL